MFKGGKTLEWKVCNIRLLRGKVQRRVLLYMPFTRNINNVCTKAAEKPLHTYV